MLEKSFWINEQRFFKNAHKRLVSLANNVVNETTVSRVNMREDVRWGSIKAQNFEIPDYVRWYRGVKYSYTVKQLKNKIKINEDERGEMSLSVLNGMTGSDMIASAR